ncbi:KGK domain-containing protein [Microcoleus sp. herbarium14]|uniref:KGK domain-containing protein n=1 Tax=Microcoleus sp. herbarium14 TaxID=3055439 RepID=UPI002FD1B70E
MNDKLKSNKNYEILDRDDDVLLFDNNNTFTVSRFKEEISRDFERKFLVNVKCDFMEKNHWCQGIKSDINSISVDSVGFRSSEIQWKGDAVNCKLLKVGFGGWQEGTVRVQGRVVDGYFENDGLLKYNKPVIDICIEFCPDRPNEPISLLDDIRQSEEYKKLLENN